MTKTLFAFAVTLIIGFSIFSDVSAQKKRDSLTETEDDIIREAQELDVRIKVYTKIIDRRFIVLSGGETAQSSNKKLSKDEKKEAKATSALGDLPTGTRAELLSDIVRSLDEATNKIDDVYGRDEKNALVSKSLNILAEACRRYLPQLKTIQATTKDDDEKQNAANAIEIAESIVKAKQDAKAVK